MNVNHKVGIRDEKEITEIDKSVIVFIVEEAAM